MAYNYYNNPYQPYQATAQPYQPYQMMPQYPQNQMSMPQAQQPQTIYGQMVDSYDAAKSKDVDMSGTPRYYPNINGSEIYVKQLQADGTCPTIVYKREIQTEPVPQDIHSESFEKILSEIENIKQMLEAPLQNQKGGKQA